MTIETFFLIRKHINALWWHLDYKSE